LIDRCDPYEFFNTIGDHITLAWSKENYDCSIFPSIAETALREFRVSERISFEHILALASRSPHALNISQAPSQFGDFQYFVYRSSRFYIEVLFWINGTTSVHDHAFSGAFTLIHGSSINVEYDFLETDRINQNFRFGNLAIKSIRLLGLGDIVRITSGRSLIHSVFHLDNPTATLVVRTVQDDEALPQLDYMGSHIAVKSDFSTSEAKAIQALKLLARYRPPLFFNQLREAIRVASRDQRFWLWRGLWSEMRVLESQEPDFLPAVLSNDYAVFRESLERDVLLSRVTRLRATIIASEARRFLAILLTAPTRDAFEELSVRCFPSGTAAPLLAVLEEIGREGVELEIPIETFASAVAGKDTRALHSLYHLGESSSNFAPLWKLMSMRLG
jgi:hypothetical protein